MGQNSNPLPWREQVVKKKKHQADSVSEEEQVAEKGSGDTGGGVQDELQSAEIVATFLNPTTNP